MDNKEFGLWLASLREKGGFESQRQLYLASKVSTSTLSRIEGGIQKPAPETLKKLAPYLKISYEELMLKAGYLQNEFIQQVDRVNRAELEFDGKILTSIPILGTIIAGIPILAEDNWEEEIDAPDNVKGDFALRVDGNSMAWAGILPGDIVILKQTSIAQHGQIVACGEEKETWVANLKFYVEQNGNKILRSANPAYDDIEMTRQHKIIGVYAGLVRTNQPTLNDYKFVLISNESLQESWTRVIEAAMDLGLEPDQVRQIVEMQGFIAKRINKDK